MNYKEALAKEPEDQRELISVKDRIFHEIMGKDGHGYCRTYGSSVPPSFVYSHDLTSVHSSTSELVENITKSVVEEVTRKLIDQFNLQIKELSKKYDDVINQMDQIDIDAEITSFPNELVPDATSAHQQESIGNGVNVYISDKEPSPMEDDEEDDVDLT